MSESTAIQTGTHTCRFDEVRPSDPNFYCECGKSWLQWNGEQNIIRMDRETHERMASVTKITFDDQPVSVLNQIAHLLETLRPDIFLPLSVRYEAAEAAVAIVQEWNRKTAL